MTMDPIKITAHIEPQRPDECRLTVEKTVHAGKARFKDAASAAGSPLAVALFTIPEIVAVRISGADVTLKKSSPDNWRPVAGKAAELIRAHLASGQPAVSPSYVETTLSDAQIREKVEAIFETYINPAVASHGGSVQLIDVRDNKIFLKMGGGCQGCGSATATLKLGIEGAIRRELPDLDEIVDVTEHEKGENPYYAPSEAGHGH